MDLSVIVISYLSLFSKPWLGNIFVIMSIILVHFDKLWNPRDLMGFRELVMHLRHVGIFKAFLWEERS